jgi:N-acetylneuraminate synthase
MVMLSEFDLLCIKAPSTISNHKNFLESIASSNVEWIMISTGGTNEEFLSWINKKFQSKNLILMQCTSSYPTAPEDCNVNVIKTISHLKSSSMLIPGYSSHDRGSLASQLAVSLGASILEKHVTLGSVEWVHFDGVALDLSVDQLGKFVRDIEVAKTILGSARKQKLNSEHHKYVPNEKHN